MSNIACRIFSEQIKLLESLPVEDAKNILYYALINSHNQFENQTDNQFDNQIDNQFYLYLNQLSVSVYNLLVKNIVWKEFSDNYGGKRVGAGKPKQNQTETKPKPNDNQPDLKEIGKKIGSKVVGKYLLDDKFNIFDVPDVDIYVDEVGRQTVIDVQAWLKDKKAGQLVDGKFICRQIYNFAKRNGLVRG